jgi:3-ketosteroid 9alpha-monooxygenase subunit A
VRFEFEVDTTKASEFWRQEVAGNLARKKAEDAAAAESGESTDSTGTVSAPTAGGGV